MKKSIPLSIIFMLLFIVYEPSVLNADILVPDMIAIKGESFLLKAETRKGFFRKGGELVEFFLNDKSIGKNLSGGDGVAFKEMTPGTEGIKRIRVSSSEEKGEGLLLVLRRGRGVVFIDVEGTLREGQYELKPKDGSKEAVIKISKKYPIIYLYSGIFGGSLIKEWLQENGFIEAPLKLWDNGSIFYEISDKGLKIKAVIGTSAVINSAGEFKPRALTFDEDVEGAKTVESWSDIVNALQ
jgi:hypothetical protein